MRKYNVGAQNPNKNPENRRAVNHRIKRIAFERILNMGLTPRDFFRLFCLSGLISGLFVAYNTSLCAQEAETPDSCRYYLAILEDLARNNQFEKAEIEAGNFRNYLDESALPCPAEAVPLVTGIYRANRNTQGAMRFLGEAEIDARYARASEMKAALLRALVRAFEEWAEPARALSNQKLLTTVQDTLSARRLTAESALWQQQLDSLQQIRRRERHAGENELHIGRFEAIIAAIILIALLGALSVSNYQNAARWRRRLLHKDIEMDLLRANLQSSLESVPPFVVEAQKKNESGPTEPARTYFKGSEGTGQTALIIEPNRQISLYLKSLLSDRFHVETAHSAPEGIQTAERLLPDLIVCDAVLNGHAGIDTARQLKLSEKTGHIPIILLSERHGNEGKLDALRAGADLWFARPFSGDALNASVQRMLEQQKEQQAAFSRFMHLYFTNSRPVIPDAFLQKTVALIEAHLSDPDFMADDLARKLQLSNQHFSKKLRALTGKEPAQLIREMRLEKAKTLLENRAAPPQTVAELVGFSNGGSFAIAFKEYFGENTLLIKS